MDNPLEQQPPQDPIERVHEFARDLAYGVAKGLWDTRFSVTGTKIDNYSNQIGFKDYLSAKWNNTAMPTIELLLSFGYVVSHREQQYQTDYLLTQKAFDRLNAPTTAPSVFVSYRRKESSALALLVEARLKLTDPDMDVFVDKDIPIGAMWEEELKTRVQNCRYFVSLIGAQSLESPHIRDEIRWALDSARKIITLTLPGFRLDAQTSADQAALVEKLSAIQSIPIQSESAEDYDSAIRKLINSMGYSTL